MAEPNRTDFSNPESCRTYLTAKFDDLLEGINNLYGRELMEELLHRMEKTVALFHQDVQQLMKGLKYEPVSPAPTIVKPTVVSSPVTIPSRAVTHPASAQSPSVTSADDWEKHLLT